MLALDAPKIVMKTGGFLYLEETPRFRHFYYKNQHYYLAFPWMYYVVKESKAQQRVERMLCSPTQYNSKTNSKVSLVPLPNMYGERPCYYLFGKFEFATQEEMVANALNAWWNGNSNNDGRCLGLAVWRRLAQAAGTINADRYGVLKYWETLSIEDVLNLQWPQNRRLLL